MTKNDNSTKSIQFINIKNTNSFLIIKNLDITSVLVSFKASKNLETITHKLNFASEDLKNNLIELTLLTT